MTTQTIDGVLTAVETSIDAVGNTRVDVIYTKVQAQKQLQILLSQQTIINAKKTDIDAQVIAAQTAVTALS